MLQGEHFAILSTFIKLPHDFKTLVLSILEWPFYTGFTIAGLCLFITVLKVDLQSVIVTFLVHTHLRFDQPHGCE